MGACYHQLVAEPPGSDIGTGGYAHPDAGIVNGRGIWLPGSLSPTTVLLL